MCGIIGSISQYRDITKYLLEGLYRLEYRGYDSAGLAVINNIGNLKILKKVGKVSILDNAVQKSSIYGHTGIAHTRWATHGEPTEVNAHPHVSGNIVIVHNGIIENHESIRNILRNRGYVFVSNTDTEVIAHLIHWEQNNNKGRLVNIIQRVIAQLNGIYAMVVMDSRSPNILVGVIFGSPLVIGCGNGENFISSDKIALLPFTKRFIFLEEGDIAEISFCTVNVWNRKGESVIRPEKNSKIYSNIGIEEKGQYRYYMQKEIFEQKNAIKNTLKGRLLPFCKKIFFKEFEDENFHILLSKVQNIQIVACGTSYHSAMVSRYWFESIAGIPCEIEISSEFRYRKFIVRPCSLLITISQSGETTDTLEALRLTKKLSYLGYLSICNISESSLARESDRVLMTRAGIEISVASTKTFTTQLTVLLMLVAYLGRMHGMDKKVEEKIVHSLQNLPSKIEEVLLYLNNPIEQLSHNFFDKKNALFLGNGNLYPIAMEGALKLKEISYIHAEAYAVGELKHGPLALIDKNMPVIVIAPNNNLLKKLKSNVEQIQARGGYLYIFTEKQSGFIENKNMKVIFMPNNIVNFVEPIIYTIPMQLLAYNIAFLKGIDIDHPRNLAKSVTVE